MSEIASKTKFNAGEEKVEDNTESAKQENHPSNKNNNSRKQNRFKFTEEWQKQERNYPKTSTNHSQSYGSSDSSSNINSLDNNSNSSSNSSFKLPDNIPAPEESLYSTRNRIYLSEPSWFYKSQAFYDGFFYL